MSSLNNDHWSEVATSAYFITMSRFDWWEDCHSNSSEKQSYKLICGYDKAITAWLQRSPPSFISVPMNGSQRTAKWPHAWSDPPFHPHQCIKMCVNKYTDKFSNKLLLRSFCRQAVPTTSPQRFTVSDKFRNEQCIILMQKDCLELII